MSSSKKTPLEIAASIATILGTGTTFWKNINDKEILEDLRHLLNWLSNNHSHPQAPTPKPATNFINLTGFYRPTGGITDRMFEFKQSGIQLAINQHQQGGASTASVGYLTMHQNIIQFFTTGVFQGTGEQFFILGTPLANGLLSGQMPIFDRLTAKVRVVLPFHLTRIQ